MTNQQFELINAAKDEQSDKSNTASDTSDNYIDLNITSKSPCCEDSDAETANGENGSKRSSASPSHQSFSLSSLISITNVLRSRQAIHGRSFNNGTEKFILPDIETCFPQYGFKLNLDHSFSKKWKPYFRIRPNQAIQMIPLAFRYLKHYVVTRLGGRLPFIDQMKVVKSLQMYGVPLGGIGSGTIGRGYRGEFCRYQMTPGIYDYFISYGTNFIVCVRSEQGDVLLHKVLCPAGRKGFKGLSAWDFDCKNDVSGRYCGLYPRSWTVYDIQKLGIRLIIRQVSPVVPHEYKDTCLPVGVFVWHVNNFSNRNYRVSLAFSCASGVGGHTENTGECWSEAIERQCEDGSTVLAVQLHHVLRGEPLDYCVAVQRSKNSGVHTSVCHGVNPTDSGSVVWESIASTGRLSQVTDAPLLPTDANNTSKSLCVLVCAETLVNANSRSEQITIALSWHTPSVTFFAKECRHSRRYERWFSGPSVAADIAVYALQRYSHWEQQIERWQQPVLDDRDLPDWFKSALFNQLYYVADGGTVWLNLNKEEAEKLLSHDPRHEYGRFAYLESQEYRMYNTYDVHFYASWALAMLWPQLQRVLQYDIAAYTLGSDLELRQCLYRAHPGVRNAPNFVPHDVGDPYDEPFLRVNAYMVHNVNEWKDLNPKFVLQVYRDYELFGNDEQYLLDMWPVCEAVIESSLKFDKDGDGLIENEGFPDQTFDTWTMHGPSAYCGSLWVSSLSTMVSMAEALKLPEKTETYKAMFTKALKAFEDKLWNGLYYNFDSCSSAHHVCIMSDQLVGHWYLALSGHHNQVFQTERVNSVLRIIYENNVLKYCNGRMGAVNGMMPDGVVDNNALQSEEMWTGVAYGLAATMIKQGMLKEGFHTAEGVYRTTHEEAGLAYDSTESLSTEYNYRAVGYMRPLSIWSMYQAWLMRNDS